MGFWGVDAMIDFHTVKTIAIMTIGLGLGWAVLWLVVVFLPTKIAEGWQAIKGTRLRAVLEGIGTVLRIVLLAAALGLLLLFCAAVPAAIPFLFVAAMIAFAAAN